MLLRNSLYDIMAQDEHSFTIRFNAAHPLFAGHFPGRPIVPGACLVQIAEELASLQAGREVHVMALKNLKFRKPVTPEMEVTVRIQDDTIEIEPYMCACADIQ